MADYYPSEVARLVLGYLNESNCPRAWETFLVESIDLQEHYRLLQSKRPCSTNIEGKSLIEILREYRFLKDAAARNEANSSSVNLNTSQFDQSSSNLNSSVSHPVPNSSNINRNASCSENFKTPQKNNAEAFNRFKIHQAAQSQATVRFAQGENRSPRSVHTFLSTPTRAHPSRTPSRLQGVCVTTLNFGSSTEKNDVSASARRGIETPRRNLCSRTPVRETISAQRLCYSEPVKKNPPMLDRMVQTDSINTSQAANNSSCQISSDSPSHQKLSSTENSDQLKSSVNSSSFNEDLLRSSNDCRNSSVRTDREENMNNSMSLLPVNRTTSNTSVVNQTIVFTSTEIRTGVDNESSVTPQYDSEPPPYGRAPGTNSPRLILSLDRSQLSSLTTPMKDRRQWPEEFASPRRKGTIPRRRLLSESPHPKQISSNDSTFVAIHENVESIIEELMANQPFTQRLADNINKVISEDPEASNSTSFPTLQDIQSSDVMIKNILARPETDLLFNDIFSLLGNNRDYDDLNFQESVTDTEGVFSITEGTQTNKGESEPAPVTKTLDSKDETDFSTKNNNTQEKRNEHNSANEASLQPPASSQEVPVSIESVVDQSVSTTTDVEVPEPMQVDDDKTNSAQQSNSKDVLGSCMSIIQPDTVAQIQSCDIEQGSMSNNDNNVQSTGSNINESSTLSSTSATENIAGTALSSASATENIAGATLSSASATENVAGTTLASTSVTENATGLDDASSLKTVSIGTPFQAASQITVPQAAYNVNQSIPTSQTVVCYPSAPLTSNAMSFIPSNRDIPFLQPVQNQSFILNSNYQPSPVLQFSYSPAPNFPVQPLDGFQSKLILISQPCSTHATNMTNNLTNDVIIPIQTVSAENVAQPSIVNSSPIKIPDDYSPSKSFLDNVVKLITVAPEAVLSKKKAEKKQSSKFTVEQSPSKGSRGRKKAQRSHKKRLKPLFPPPKDPDLPTESEICGDIPVLSIPDPSPNKEESMSAMEILTSITEGKNTQSPLLKAMISSAKILAEKGGRLNSTHVRTLEFPSPQVEEKNKSEQSKSSAEGSGRRSSPRLKQKTSCKSPCCSPLRSCKTGGTNKNESSKQMTKEKDDMTANLVTNAIEKLTARKAVSSSMSNVVLSAMQDALQAKPVKTKKQDSSVAHDMFRIAEISLSPRKKTPSKCPSANKETVIPRDQYFPDSSSSSDSDSDNIPLSLIVASKSKGTVQKKKTKTSPPKSINSQKTNVEKDPVKNVEKEMPPANVESTIELPTDKDSAISDAVSFNSKPSVLSKTIVEKSNSMEDISANITKLVSPSKADKSYWKGCGSSIIKSTELEDVQEETFKESKKPKNSKPTLSCFIPEVTGDSPCDPIVLESDEDVSETCNENVSSQVIGNTERKSSHKKEKRSHRKKKHLPKLTSPLKGKTCSRKKTKGKDSHPSRKSNSPRAGGNSEQLLQHKNSDSLAEMDSHPSRKSNSPRTGGNVEQFLQHKNSDSLAEKGNHKASKESCSEKDKKILHGKKSKAENSYLSQILKEKENVNEANDYSLSNKETNVSPLKNNCQIFPNSPTEKKEKSGQKGNWYISSPQKEKEVLDNGSSEMNQNLSGSKKKNRSINELCDKLLLNAVQNSPMKERTLMLLTETDKLSDTAVKSSVEVPANETSLRNYLHLETVVSSNPTQNETLKLASVEMLGEEKSIVNTKVRNDITISSEVNIDSKQSSKFDEPIKPNVKRRVLPPTKKRIRPVPVASPRDGSFSPFSPFSSPAHAIGFDSTLKPNETSSVSRNTSVSEINKMVSSQPEPPFPAHAPRKDPKPKEMLSSVSNASNMEVDQSVSSAPELNILRNAVPFGSPSKTREMPSRPTFNVRSVRKYSLGKPKAMAEFYKSVLPDRDSDLPVSPDPMSSSSCTVDTFLARRNAPPTDACEASPSKKNNLVNETSPQKKETEKVGQKRKHSSSEKDSSDEEGLVKSPPRAETVIEKIISDTESAPEIATQLSSQVQTKDSHLSSSDEEGLIKSPVKNVGCERKSDRIVEQPGKKRKLSTGFSPHHETFTRNTSDQVKSSETDNSFSVRGKTVEKSPVRHSALLNKAKLKSSLKRNAVLPMIPAGVKIPPKWGNSKINNYSDMITPSESEMRSRGPRRSRPNIKVVGFISPPRTNSSLKRRNDHPSGFISRPNPYRTLYSERQARKLQFESRRSPFRASPNVNNSRSSAHRHRDESKLAAPPNSISDSSKIGFSKETGNSRKYEDKCASGKSNKSDSQKVGIQKHFSSNESSKNNTGKHESPTLSSKISNSYSDNHHTSNKHAEKSRRISSKKFDPGDEKHDKSSTKIVEESRKVGNIPTSKKSKEGYHKQGSSSEFLANEEIFNTHDDKHILSKEKSTSASENKSSRNSIDRNVSSFVSEKGNTATTSKLPIRSYDEDTELKLGACSKQRNTESRRESHRKNSSQVPDTEEDGMNPTGTTKLPSRLSDKDTELKLGTCSKKRSVESRRESQLGNPSQVHDTEKNKQVFEEQSDLNCENIVDEAVGGISRTSSDQNELDQAVAFITNDENPESQEPVISSQNTDDGSQIDGEDFEALVIRKLSKALGLAVPMRTEEIAHLLDKIKEIGIANITGVFGKKK